MASEINLGESGNPRSVFTIDSGEERRARDLLAFIMGEYVELKKKRDPSLTALTAFKNKIIGKSYKSLRDLAPYLLEEIDPGSRHKKYSDVAISPADLLDRIFVSIDSAPAPRAIADETYQDVAEVVPVFSIPMDRVAIMGPLFVKSEDLFFAAVPVFRQYLLQQVQEGVLHQQEEFNTQEMFDGFRECVRYLTDSGLIKFAVPLENMVRVFYEPLLTEEGYSSFYDQWAEQICDVLGEDMNIDQAHVDLRFSYGQLVSNADAPGILSNSGDEIKAIFLKNVSATKGAMTAAIESLRTEQGRTEVTREFVDNLVLYARLLIDEELSEDISEDLFVAMINELSPAERWMLYHRPEEILAACRARFPHVSFDLDEGLRANPNPDEVTRWLLQQIKFLYQLPEQA